LQAPPQLFVSYCT